MWPLSIFFGALVGLALGLTGGGGSIFAVPLLVYGLGVDPHSAVGISLAAVGATAAFGFVQRAWRGEVEIATGLLFAVAGMAGAPLGSWLNAQVPAEWLMGSVRRPHAPDRRADVATSHTAPGRVTSGARPDR